MNTKSKKWMVILIGGSILMISLLMILENRGEIFSSNKNTVYDNTEDINSELDMEENTVEEKNEPEDESTNKGDIIEDAGKDFSPGKPVEPSIEEDIPSLAEVFSDYFSIGAAIEPGHTTGLIAELYKKHVNMLVAENSMKPEAIQPTEGNFTWGAADRLVQFAKENGMELRFHTLVWHNQTPDWFFRDNEGKPMIEETDPKKREENKKLLLKRLEEHIRAVVSRYKDDIKSWDVVNEVIEPSDPDGMRNSPWYQITGTEFIETAFRIAREAGGNDIKLYINDYGTDAPAGVITCII